MYTININVNIFIFYIIIFDGPQGDCGQKWTKIVKIVREVVKIIHEGVKTKVVEIFEFSHGFSTIALVTFFFFSFFALHHIIMM